MSLPRMAATAASPDMMIDSRQAARVVGLVRGTSNVTLSGYVEGVVGDSEGVRRIITICEGI
jgi:hypothetical protein